MTLEGLASENVCTMIIDHTETEELILLTPCASKHAKVVGGISARDIKQLIRSFGTSWRIKEHYEALRSLGKMLRTLQGEDWTRVAIETLPRVIRTGSMNVRPRRDVLMDNGSQLNLLAQSTGSNGMNTLGLQDADDPLMIVEEGLIRTQE